MPKKNDLKSWVDLINNISKENKNFNSLRKNALNTASKYTWEKRAKKIDFFFKKQLLKN